MVDGVTDGDVSVQRDGAQVHDGGCGEEHIKKDPHGTQQFRERPGVIWKKATRGHVSETQARTDMSRVACLVLLTNSAVINTLVYNISLNCGVV